MLTSLTEHIQLLSPISGVSTKIKLMWWNWINGPWLGHVCEYEYLIIMHLFTLAFTVWLDERSQVDKGENLYKVEHGSDAILGYCIRKQWGGVFVCITSLQARAKKDKENCLLFSLEARGSGWFWGCVSAPSWCFSPSCWTAQQEAGRVKSPTPFCGRDINFSICLS